MRELRSHIHAETVYQGFALLVALILVHGAYVGLVRPQASAILEQQAIRIAADPSYVPEQSAAVIVKDFEQEACFVLLLWALAIMAYKLADLRRERQLLDAQLLPLGEGVKILPEDTREHARHIQGFAPAVRDLLLPRALLAGLRRFAATRSIQDVSAVTASVCDAESERLESELSMIRYIAWAIPSLGFIGTVRGIGSALGRAHQAVGGDISGVTESLAVAFNSTFIALLLSIVLMFAVHQLQSGQERLVRDARAHLDESLLQRLCA
jgi:biopolymer transport protein ExbB/TolQ